MNIKNQLPNYETFLEATNYSSIEVEKYFDTIQKALEQELISLVNESDENLKNIYDVYEEKVKDYDTIKTDILRKYFHDYDELNKNAEKEISQLNNDYYTKRSELIDIIQQDNSLLSSIKYNFLMKFYEKKKEPAFRIKRIIDKTNIEFQNHADLIFKAKNDLVTNNSEYYMNIENHLLDIGKTINFLEELLSYTKNLKHTNLPIFISNSIDTIDVYLEHIQKEKAIASDISSLISKYSVLEKGFNEAYLDISNRYKLVNSDIKKLNKDILNKRKLLDKDLETVNSYFDEKISKEEDSFVKNSLSLQKKAFINKVSYDIDHLLIESHIEKTFLEKHKENLKLFHDSLNNLSSSLNTSYQEYLNKNKSFILNTFDALNSILLDLKNTVLTFKNDSKDAREIIAYFEKKFDLCEIENKITILKEYQDSLNKNLSDNKKLDVLAFTILTNEEIVKMKLLDLKQEFLTIDDETLIKQISYDIEIEEMKETKNPILNIENTKNELFLLKKDLDIDVSIVQNELKNSIYMLDLRKNIDFVRCDYMSAYARLDNVCKIIDSKGEKDNLAAEIKTQVQVQRIFELFLLETISLKNQLAANLVYFENRSSELDIDTQQRYRYLNNVLEVERDKFKQKKIDLLHIYNDLKKMVYPDMVNLKDKSAHFINYTKFLFDKINHDEEKHNLEQFNKINLCNKEINKVLTNTIDSINKLFPQNSLLELFNNIDASVFSTIPLNIFDELVNIINSKLQLLVPEFTLISVNKKKLAMISSSFKQQFNTAKTSKAKQKLFANFNTKLIGVANNLYENYKKQICSILPLDENELSSLLLRYENVKKGLLVDKAIKTTEQLNTYYDDIDNIENAKNTITEDINKQIAETKKNYLETSKIIENEYKQKLYELDVLKNNFFESNKANKENLKKLVYDNYEQLENKYLLDVKNNKEQNIKSSKDAKNTVSALSKNIEAINNNLDKKQKESEISNKKFRSQKGIEAKEIFIKTEEHKINNKLALEEREKQKQANRQKYIDSISLESLKIKDDYQDKKVALEDSIDNEKLEKTEEYGKLFEQIKTDSLNAHVLVSDIEENFEQQVEGLTDLMFKKTDSLAKEISAKSSDNLQNSIDKLNKLKNMSPLEDENERN